MKKVFDESGHEEFEKVVFGAESSALSGVLRQPEYNLMLFQETSPFVERIRRLVRHPLFEATIMVLIVASVLMLALAAPENPDFEKDPAVLAFNYFVVAAFTLEALLKMIEAGLLFTPYAYLKSPWNQLAFTILFLDQCG